MGAWESAKYVQAAKMICAWIPRDLRQQSPQKLRIRVC